MNILRLVAELGLNATGFLKGMDDARKKSQSVAGQIGQEFKSKFLSYLSAGAVLGAIRHIAEEIDHIQDSSKRLGVTTDQFQQMSIAAQRAGLELGGSKGLGKVFNDIAEMRAKAEGGDIKAIQQLQDLGLSMYGAADASETMFDAFEKVIHLSDSKLAEVFGGRALLDIKAFRDEMQKAKDATVYSADEIDSIKRFSEATKDLWRFVSVQYAKTVLGKKGFIDFIGSGVFPGGKAGVEFFRRMLGNVASGIQGVQQYVSPIGPVSQALQDTLVNNQISELEKQLLELSRKAGTERGGRDIGALISELTGRFGIQGLVGVQSALPQNRPMNPELRKKMEEIEGLLRELRDKKDNTILFGQ